jgi:hypothetical protein
MTTVITEMSPSKMEITSKGEHPTIQPNIQATLDWRWRHA